MISSKMKLNLGINILDKIYQSDIQITFIKS